MAVCVCLVRPDAFILRSINVTSVVTILQLVISWWENPAITGRKAKAARLNKSEIEVKVFRKM